MDIICASICYRGYADDELEATFTFAPKIGYRLMEVHGPEVWSVAAVKIFDLLKVHARLTESGLLCAGIYCPGWGGSNDHEVAVHADAIATCAHYAQQLGAHHVTSTGASKRNESAAIERVITCVQQVLDKVPASNPVRFALEPHYGNVLQQPEDFERIFSSIKDPRVGMCVDTGHFHSAGVNIAEVIRHFGTRIYNVHVKDHIGTDSVGIGRGEIDLAGVLAALHEIGYKGDLTVELEVNDPQNLPRYTEEAYIYLSGMLGRKL